MEICLEICGVMIIWNLPDADKLIYYSGHFGAIKFPFTILHPYFMAEIAEILKKICPACKSIRHELRIKVRYLLFLPTLARFIWICYNRDLVLKLSILYNLCLNMFWSLYIYQLSVIKFILLLFTNVCCMFPLFFFIT